MQNWKHCLHILSFVVGPFPTQSVHVTLFDLTGRSKDKNQGPE